MPRFGRVGGLHEALGPCLAEAWEAGRGGLASRSTPIIGFQ
eukprot:CAMPEP_0184378508 /NCGR_PEP_ID=MMETSP0007-20130409/3138_1 /TAXON_ID=97485 /ORGANISM="Prymnesium parvum, Strain Texoma1" /LENGTH=40 /DNA_ID= /DNA_START= /DNA_END= /DNA_ORIENTATION=